MANLSHGTVMAVPLLRIKVLHQHISDTGMTGIGATELLYGSFSFFLREIGPQALPLCL
jgi:hypothetical protein